MAAPKPGGFKMSLGALKAKPGFKASPLQKDTKRPRLALDEDEPDESNKQQEIVGWDAAEGGAVDANEKKEKQVPRVIPALPNRDWRSEARQKQLAKAPHQQVQEGNEVKEVAEPKIQYGLTIIKKDVVQEAESGETVTTESVEIEVDNLTEEQRLEKKALDALLNGKSSDNDAVIPIQAEEDTFLDDVRNAPDAPTLEAYEATPIEGFGAAMLRGMGWKDDEETKDNGSAAKPQVIKRRPALLGIGAKEEAATGVELGEFSSKGKGKKVAQNYNPVTLRNKHTGELISEDELKAKLENQEMVKDSEPDGRRKGNDKEKDEGDGRREKRREKKDEQDRHREWDRDRERDRDRDRRRDDYYDSDRRRDKRTSRDDDHHDRERRRDKRRDRSRSYEYGSERRKDKRRERSRSPNGKKTQDRDRYRSRSRDSRKRRDRRDTSEDSEDRRKRRKERDYEYDRHRDDRKKRYKDDKHYK